MRRLKPRQHGRPPLHASRQKRHETHSEKKLANSALRRLHVTELPPGPNARQQNGQKHRRRRRLRMFDWNSRRMRHARMLRMHVESSVEHERRVEL